MNVMQFLRAASGIALAAAASLVVATSAVAATQEIKKVENKALIGTAYARLRKLTYAQCEARCLADRSCKGLEYYDDRGGARSYNCALFNRITGSRNARGVDAGFKRTVVVQEGSGRVGGKKKAAKRRAIAREASPRAPTDGVAGGFGTKGAGPGGGGTGGAAGSGGYSTRGLGSGSSASRPSGAEQAARLEAARREREVARLEAERKVRVAEAERKAREEMQRAAEDVRRRAAEAERKTAEMRRRAAEIAQPKTAAPPPRPSALPSPDAARGITAPEAGSTRGLTAPPPAAAAAPPPDYHIVPVFYGTDRNRSDTAKRIAYGNDRARRLEMGQALVTVPLSHKVPNIERPSAWSIPWFGKIWEAAEDPKQHFTIKELKTLSKADLLDLVKKRLGLSESFKDQAIVFIHGYNVGFDDALYRTAQIAYDLQFDGAAFTYSWPSGSGWTSYAYSRDSAQQAEPYLYEFLQMVQNETGTKSISIIAHSMGNQILLQVLRDLKRRSPGVSKINQIVLAAPDVDRDTFTFLASEISGIAKGVTLYASSNDKALEASRFIAGNIPRAGDVPAPPEGPVVISGIDTIDISAISTSYLFSLNHSDYAEHTELLTDLNHLIRTGLRPPNLRITAYRRIDGSAGPYWRYGP